MPKAKTLQEIKKFNLRNQEQARQKIKVTKLIQRMQDFAMAETHIIESEDSSGKAIKTVYFQDEKGKQVHPMTKEQITAASKVIDKALPNITKLESEHTENKVHSLSMDTLAAIESLTQQAALNAEKVIEGEIIEVERGKEEPES